MVDAYRKLRKQHGAILVPRNPARAIQRSRHDLRTYLANSPVERDIRNPRRGDNAPPWNPSGIDTEAIARGAMYATDKASCKRMVRKPYEMPRGLYGLAI